MDKLVFHEYGQGVRLDSLEQELNLNEKEVYALIRQFNGKRSIVGIPTSNSRS